MPKIFSEPAWFLGLWLFYDWSKICVCFPESNVLNTAHIDLVFLAIFSPSSPTPFNSSDEESTFKYALNNIQYFLCSCTRKKDTILKISIQIDNMYVLHRYGVTVFLESYLNVEYILKLPNIDLFFHGYPQKCI